MIFYTLSIADAAAGVLVLLPRERISLGAVLSEFSNFSRGMFYFNIRRY